MRSSNALRLLSAAFLVMTLSPAAGAGQLTLDYAFDRPQVTPTRIGDTLYYRVVMEGATNGGPVGSPALPASGARILLPLGVEVKSVEVITGERVLLGSNLLVEPVGQPYRLMDGPGSLPMPTPDPAIYDSHSRYPAAGFEEIGTQSFRGYQILVLRLQPVAYIPTTGELFYSPNLQVVVETAATQSTLAMFRGFDHDASEVRGRVDNPEVVDSYEAAGTRGTRAYNMMILTTDALAGSFTALKAYHDGQGLATEIHTTTDVGSSDPATVRDYIRDAYLNDGIDYVLIGGDDDIIPAQNLYVDSFAGEVESTMPGDIYFGCLDGTWNEDGDGRFGEPNDGAGGGDVDMLAEVFVGRCSAGDTTEVDRFVTKTIWYLSGSHSLPAEVLLVGEYLGFGGISDYAAATLEELEDGSSANGYTTVGIPTADYSITEMFERDMTWTQATLATAINNGVHILNHLGHGSPDFAAKFYNSDVMSQLDNTELLFFYSQTCLAGHLDDTDCWAETMNIKTDHGAFALVMNARYGWGANNSTDGPSQRFNREFWDAVFDEAMPEVGKANQDSKEDNLYRIGEPCMRWCTYELNLFGDPAAAIQGEEVTGMKVSPSGSFDPKGMAGGPFSPSSEVYTIENMDATTLDFTVSKGMGWVDLSSTGGTLLGGGSTTVTVSINSEANSLGNGMYSDAVSFTNTTNHDGDTNRAVNLQVGVPTMQTTWDMSSDPGWTTEGLWAYGVPSGGGGEYGSPDPTGGHSGSNVYGYDLSGDYANDLPETHLTSTAIDCSGLDRVSVKFWRHLNVEQPSYDHAYLRVSTDGANWSEVWENTAEVADASWTPMEYDISDEADGQSTVYLRWTMGATDGGWRYSGWNIDDVEVWGLDSIEAPLFADGFESGDCLRWSTVIQ
jgi:Peptidase family C25